MWQAGAGQRNDDWCLGMSTEFDRFDDPALRAAIKGAFGNEKAPDDLRQRILGLMTQSPAQASPPRHARLFAWRSFVTSVAAGFLLALAGVYAFSHFSADTRSRQVLVEAMVATHDTCCARESHTMAGLPTEDVRRIGQAIEERLHDGVLAADLSEDGWEFKGASICSVNGEPSAHFVFGRRRARMSVFSLPKSASANIAQTDLYSDMVSDHCVAAFTQGGQVYGMVGFCPNRNMKVSEVASLLQKHRSEIISPALASAALPREPLH